MPSDGRRWVQQPQTEAELAALRCSVARGRPFGDEHWAQRTAKRFGLQSTFRSPGRQRKMGSS
jgi:putative transposase